MSSQRGLFKTSVMRKNVMAVTGLFIAFFLIIHLAGNLILIIPDSWFPIEFWGGVANQHDMYNAYSHFLVHFWPITIVAWILYAAIIIHALDALLITLKNSKSNADDKYIKKDTSTSNWYSRNMGILGSIIGIFLVIHMGQFWLKYKVLGTEHDLYNLVVATFKQEWVIILYLIGFISLGFHLVHGIESAHRSLGVHKSSCIKILKNIAMCFGIVMAVLYAIIPIIIYFK